MKRKLQIKPNILASFAHGIRQNELNPDNIESAMVTSVKIDEPTVVEVDADYVSNTALFLYDSKNEKYTPIRNGDVVKPNSFLSKSYLKYIYAVFTCVFSLKTIKVDTNIFDDIDGLKLMRQYFFNINLMVENPLKFLYSRNVLAHHLNDKYLAELANSATDFHKRTVASQKIQNKLTKDLRNFGIICTWCTVTMKHLGDTTIEKANETLSAIRDVKNNQSVKMVEVEGTQRIKSMERDYARAEGKTDFEIQQEREKQKFELENYKRQIQSQQKIEDEMIRQMISVGIKLEEMKQKLHVLQQLFKPGDKPLSKRERQMMAIMQGFIPELGLANDKIHKINADHERRRNKRRQLG